MEKEKKAIRRRMNLSRDNISASERQIFSKVICTGVISMREYAEAGVILLFSTYRSEVDTSLILKSALEQGKKVYYPKVEGDFIVFHRVFDEIKLAPGYKGIPEPDISLPVFEYNENEKCVCVCPGSAFSESRQRLGYGGGFYDRFLAGKDKLFKCGICFDCQINRTLPCNENDILMDRVITEKRTIS